jgi:hypothetical protein
MNQEKMRTEIKEENQVGNKEELKCWVKCNNMNGHYQK